MTAERVGQPQGMSFSIVPFADVGSDECANHVRFHWPGLNITM